MEGRSFFSVAFGKGILCILILLSLFFVSCSKQTPYPEAARTASDVVIDVKTLGPEVPQFFTYRHQGKNINFFVVKIGDNVFSYLDACAKCYASKRGYGFQSGYLVCKACNVRYSISEIEKGFGSCFPLRLPGRLQGDKCLIPLLELEKASNKF